MEYNFRDIEKKWQQWWAANKVYKVSNDSPRPKCYVLDMFPYPSGAGLHVGHPLGYIASDIYSRYKRLKGFNVLHPMGYDAFGLPAEQYAIEHGIHPAVSTAANINNFRSQLDKIGFCFDWDREVNTSKPGYYKWTQWIFLQLFNSYYNRLTQKAESIMQLMQTFEAEGSSALNVKPSALSFTPGQWKLFDEKKKMDILMEHRLAYCGYGEVNWCEALGTVLANDEVVNGVSERGGHPVVKKTLRQWYLRITEYADRLLEGLDKVDFSDAMKEMQTNWIGKSTGAEIDFKVVNRESSIVNDPLTIHDSRLTVYTTRPDTIFGVDFMVIAPELDLVNEIKSAEQSAAVDEYLAYVKSRSERERMAEKKISGVFTGSYALNPFNGREIPIWISEYVLAGYGTGAIMGVPCGDERDHKFAKHFNIPVTNIIGEYYNGEDANPTYDAKLQNSDFLNGIEMRKAIDIVISHLELAGIGKRKVNYRMRDAAFSRQRYWGEPFPIIWKDEIAYALDESELPVELPHMDDLKPGPDAQGPLANLPEWTNYKGGTREVNTMPGYAGSSWYFLRYMDPDNDQEFCSRQASDYWGQVDLYIGGTEHAVGHLLYSRMWTKFLFDIGLIGHDEPYKRLVNQGMITGVSMIATTIMRDEALRSRLIVPAETEIVEGKAELIKYHIPVDMVEVINGKHVLTQTNLEILKKNNQNYYGDFDLADENNIEDAFELKFGGIKKKSILDNLKKDYVTLTPVPEKMSKSKLNTFNPDDLVMKYGADTFRMYEMFLGPVEMSKPWDTKGIEGVHRFLKKFWRLFFAESKTPPSEGLGEALIVTDDEPTPEELKVLHTAIRKIESDTERFSFNTGVSAFMIATNELTDLKCHKRKVLEPLLILLAPYAPHITEELYQMLGSSQVSPGGFPEQSEGKERSSLEGASILNANYPRFEEKYVKETTKAYPIAINGKTRSELTLSLDATQEQVEQLVLKDPAVQKWLEGKSPKKVIYVKNKMINVVI